MFEAISSPYLVPFDGSFHIADAPTEEVKRPKSKESKAQLDRLVDELDELQRRLYALDQHSVLLVFQALDAAGKDSTIRAVLRGVNPAGCQVFSFKKPSSMELDHDFLWRTARVLPERGRIGVFNRSYYEEVLVVRVHPEILTHQRLPFPAADDQIWKERLESIADHEKHLARNGTVILKFWLNVSEEEQLKRFLKRIDEPEKNWKFSEADARERNYRKQYMEAYEEALKATSTPWAPWYAIPADDKPFMRATVAKIVVESLRTLSLDYPSISEVHRKRLKGIRKMLA